MHSPHPVPPWLTVLGWITWAYLHLVLPRELVFLSGTCSLGSSHLLLFFYWTLFCRQSRKEERRGTLIAHLNGGCHIINAYRPALQAVTETPSHTSREAEGEWDINSCERRDGYQRPEIKWLALKEMKPGKRHPFEFEFAVRVLHSICLSAPNLIFCLSHFLSLCYLSLLFHMLPVMHWYESTHLTSN